MDRTPTEAATLTCWKDIANYLGKGVRTVQRWEQEFGLPVRRPNGMSHKSPVAADPRELDAWMRSNWSVRAEQAEHAAANSARHGNGSSKTGSVLIEELRRNIQRSADLREALQLSRRAYRDVVRQVSDNTISLGLHWQLAMSSPPAKTPLEC